MSTVKIGNRIVGKNKPVLIVAEVASAHQGDVDICKELVEKVGRSGADAIKFQKFTAEELVVAGPSRKHFKEIEFSDTEWREVFSVAKKFNWEILADVFDVGSCDLMNELGASAFKIHSTDLTNPYLISHVAEKEKPILLGVGGGTNEEIRGAIETIRSYGKGSIILVHGFQAYPTKLEDTNLKLIQTLGEVFGLNVGYHDHVDAESEMALFLPCMAIPFGATIIEKHVILDRSGKGLDYQSALTPEEFKKMVGNVRDFERAVGSGKIELSAAEKKYREEVRKNIVAKTNIPAKTVIKLEMLAFKRSKPGLSPTEAVDMLGKKAKVDIKKDEVITWDKLL
jgi:sialic acid synthase SpsE